MYSPKIIERRLDFFATQNGWMPVRHSFDEVRNFTEYIKKVVKLESNSKSTWISSIAPMTDQRKAEIRRWIENEQVLCGLDSSYWESRYAYVTDEAGIIKKFKNRRSQDVFDSIIGYLEELQAGIQVLCLKGRQVGITTKVGLKFVHRMLTVPNTLAVMASVQKSKSDEIKIKLDTAYDMCPFWLVPMKGPKNSFVNGSRLMIESGMQPKGIAQGQTPQLIHISEIGIIPNPHNVIEEGLLPATHSNKNLFMVFEGTGSGNVGWFPDFWRSQKRDWPLGLARMCPVFIPWHLATDMYPQEDWLRAHPVPPGYYERRLEATRAHIARCESYIRNTPYLAKVMGASYSVPIEQQWWWELEYRQAKERHSLQQHAARLPADDFEALTGVHDSVFDQETLAEVEEQIYEVRTDGSKQRRNKFTAYAIVGHSIEEEFLPTESMIDANKSKIQLSHVSARGEKYDWELVPLLPVDEESEVDTLDKLLVYEEPLPNQNYSCGVDTAHGLGKEDEDRFCASMTRVATGPGCDVQCLAGGTLVTTKESVKRIEDVNLGDMVVNRLGQYAEVVSRSQSTKPESLLLYTGMAKNEPLKLTPDHRVATASGWVEAQNLKKGDWLMYPVRRLTESISSEQIVLGNYLTNGKRRTKKVVKASFNWDFGFACGLYLAEGSIGVRGKDQDPYMVSFTLHEREGSAWKKILSRAMPGLYIGDCPMSASRAHRLVVSCKEVATWFSNNFGRLQGKHIPSWVWNAPREFVEGFVQGMVAGDGSIDKRIASVTYGSTIPALVIGIRDLILSLGWGLGTIGIERKEPHFKDFWRIYFFGGLARKFMIDDMIRAIPRPTKLRQSEFRWGWNKEWIYVPVKKIIPFEGGTFYDLTVSGSDPSFCVMQAAVHNCAELTSNRFSPAQAVPFLAAMATWYGKRARDRRGVKFSIEQIEGPGDTCQNQLKIMGFNWHHVPGRLDGKKVKDENKHREGWYSNRTTVPILMDRFVEAVNGGWYVPQSKWLIEELRTLERHTSDAGRDKMVHAKNKHDDRVRAAAQSYLNMHTYDDLAGRAQRRYATPIKRKRDPNEGHCTMNSISVGGDE